MKTLKKIQFCEKTSREVLNRVLSRVLPTDTVSCWMWSGWTDGRGYGKISVAGKAWYVHRVIYYCFFGEIPEFMVLDHVCCNKSCCNPFHLEPVTVSVNTSRAIEKARGDSRS